MLISPAGAHDDHASLPGNVTAVAEMQAACDTRFIQELDVIKTKLNFNVFHQSVSDTRLFDTSAICI